MKIGLAAYRFINNDIAFNVAQIEKGMKASQGKADLLCFGETFLQGFDALKWDYEHDKNIGIALDSEIVQQLCGLTRQYGVDLLLGYVEKEADKLYSSCMVIADGNVIHNYRRISKGWKEFSRTNEHYCEGIDTPNFLYKGKAFRIALCGDLWEYPERFKTEATLLWPVYVNFSLPEWQQYEQEYAQQAALAASRALLINSITDDPEAIGGAFCYENAQITARLPYNTEDILYVEV